MCYYHYIYFDKCRHCSFYKVSYCDEAKRLGLDKLETQSSGDNNVDKDPSSASDHSSSQAAASYADTTTSSHSHNQHDSHKMSALTHSGVGTMLASNAMMTPRSEQLPQNAALIPRSALQECGAADHENSASHASSLLSTDDQRGLNLNASSDTHSRSSIKINHDVSRKHHTHASGDAVAYSTVSETSTVRATPRQRKAIPSQWVSPGNGPVLATAQRAQERGHKPDSASGSPTKAKSLRNTRSMVDMSRSHATEGSSFLTKTAHQPLESDLTSPTAGKSPSKHQRPTKPAWNSPSSSPLRESPRQHAHRASQAKATAFLTTEIAPHGHRRGTSSVATSTAGESVYHSAETSPVRDTAGSALSFKSAAEILIDDDHIPDLDLSADFDPQQKLSILKNNNKAATVGTASKPRLKVKIPHPDVRADAGDNSSASRTSATNDSAASSSPWSPASVPSVSRIPRVTTAGNSSLARGPTGNSGAGRSLSTDMTSSTKIQQHVQSNHQPNAFTASARHVQTVGSSGTTPILSRQPTPEHISSPKFVFTVVETDSCVAPHTPAAVEQITSSLRKASLDIQQEQTTTDRSRASSVSTIRAAPPIIDSVVAAPADSYSKEPGAFGMTSSEPFTMPATVVMMANKLEADDMSRDNYQQRVSSLASTSAYGDVQDMAPARGRTAQYVPTARRQAESDHSLQSSQTSDLRATAAEFFPYPKTIETAPKLVEGVDITQLDPSTDLLGPVKYELDMYGIPWYYYMYQVQFAFDQGYQKGRSTSPKKTRRKKQYPSTAAPVDARPPEANIETSNNLRQDQHVLPPSASGALAEQLDNVETTKTLAIEGASAHQRPYFPFAAQMEIIDRQLPYPNATVTERPVPGIDLTTIRNVGLPRGARAVPSENANNTHTMPNRGRHNSNTRRNHHRSDNGLYTYRGRGAAGMPMTDTVPFPDAVPPQGRPSFGNVDAKGCGVVDIIYAAERIGGEACHNCEPDHPLD